MLIITHGEIGEQLVKTATSTLGGKLPLQCRALSVSQSCDPDALGQRASNILTEMSDDDELLVLTDMYGSTPSNIANRLSETHKVRVIAGVNLPMFIRILNYPTLELDELIEKALSGGHDGIILCE